MGWFFKGSKNFGMIFLGALRALGCFGGGSKGSGVFFYGAQELWGVILGALRALGWFLGGLRAPGWFFWGSEGSGVVSWGL